MAGVTLEYQAEEVLAAIRQVTEALGSPERMLRDMGEYLMIAHDQRFASQTAPDGTPWQALSPAYQRRKKKNADKVLVLDGYLKNTLRYQVAGNEMVFGTNRVYAAIHQFGGEIQMPARSQQAYFRQDKSGDIGKQFVSKRRSNFSQWVTMGPHVIKIPARPFLGTSAADDIELTNIAMGYLSRAMGTPS